MEQDNAVVARDRKPPAYRSAPFFRRVHEVLSQWIAGEWEAREAIRREAMVHGWNDARRRAYDDAMLTAQNLARAIDNISLTKLRRELGKIGAPSPGHLIREARIQYAKHLLVTGRLLVREVALRAGYGKERHFTEVFTAAVGVTPSEYRRLSIWGRRSKA
ncbi:MAG: helix-turn-helix transcriptional regulator [Hyphomicrobiaceae bacterium]|jgi:AraC-like DNA-binding protein